jgi:hypothetical protein
MSTVVDSIAARTPQVVAQTTVATVITGSERSAFLGRLFGGFKHSVERHVVRALTELCGSGTLGPWEFVALSNGGGYLRPPAKLYVISAPNFMHGRVTAEVAGLIASLFALAELRLTYRAEGIFGLRYSQLHEYAADHPQASVVFHYFEL